MLSQRRQILRVLLQTYKHSCTEDDIHSIADRAHGYVGADLSAVCRVRFLFFIIIIIILIIIILVLLFLFAGCVDFLA